MEENNNQEIRTNFNKRNSRISANILELYSWAILGLLMRM